MKVLRNILVLLVIFSVSMAGNVYSSGTLVPVATRSNVTIVNDSNTKKCYRKPCDEYYFGEGNHTHRGGAVRSASKVQQLYCSQCNTKYPADPKFRHEHSQPVRVIKSITPIVRERKQLPTQQVVQRQDVGFVSPVNRLRGLIAQKRQQVDANYAVSKNTSERNGDYYANNSNNSKTSNFSLVNNAYVSAVAVQQPTRINLGNLYGVNQYGYRYVRYPTGTGYTSRGNRNIFR